MRLDDTQSVYCAWYACLQRILQRSSLLRDQSTSSTHLYNWPNLHSGLPLPTGQERRRSSLWSRALRGWRMIYLSLLCLTGVSCRLIWERTGSMAVCWRYCSSWSWRCCCCCFLRPSRCCSLSDRSESADCCCWLMKTRTRTRTLLMLCSKAMLGLWARSSSCCWRLLPLSGLREARGEERSGPLDGWCVVYECGVARWVSLVLVVWIVLACSTLLLMDGQESSWKKSSPWAECKLGKTAVSGRWQGIPDRAYILHSYPLHHHHLPVLCTSLVTPYAYMLARVHDDDAKWRLPAEEGKVSNGILSLLSIIVIIIHCRVHSMPWTGIVMMALVQLASISSQPDTCLAHGYDQSRDSRSKDRFEDWQTYSFGLFKRHRYCITLLHNDWDSATMLHRYRVGLHNCKL